MHQKKIILLTSNKIRHNWVAKQLAKHFNLIGIVTEPKSSFYTRINEESEIIRKHFMLNEMHESYYFGEQESFPDTEILSVNRDDINLNSTIEWAEKKAPDYIFLFGTGIIKGLWFKYWNDKIINMHLGLSPYYKGSGTNFWPLVNNEPEYVGATILITDQGVDTGNIITQVRPDILLSDTSYDIGMKTIINGVQAMIDSVTKLQDGVKLVDQMEMHDVNEKIYKRKNFTEESVIKHWENFNNGMISSYLENFNERVNKVKIII
jgi:methionyl-tRNA formyltransferase